MPKKGGKKKGGKAKSDAAATAAATTTSDVQNSQYVVAAVSYRIAMLASQLTA